MPIESSAIFTRDGGAFVPSDLAQGPWDPDAQHGGPVAALLARAVEQHEHETGLMVVRMTVELLRPVPLAPLTVTTETQRPGKRVQWIEARLQIASTGVEVARARALRGRLNPFELPSSAADSDSRPAPPETGDVMNDTLWPGFARAMERRPVAGRAFPELGPATVWFRLRNPLVAGEEPSGLQRVMASADFGNGISSVLPYQSYFFINPDLSVYLHRSPEGEWICLDSVTHPDASGIGITESVLFDRTGRIGRAMQSLLIGERSPGPAKSVAGG